jgi:predicted DNA-binding mobile mystery protein A
MLNSKISSKKHLLVEQIDRKIAGFRDVKDIAPPPEGWLHTVRIALGMSLRQLGARMHVTPQSAKELEMREASGSITLRSLREAAGAMGMRLVYGFVPDAGSAKSIDEMIERRAEELAKEIVLRTSASMKLEDQENSPERLKKAVKQRAAMIKEEMPRYLWS